MVSISNQTRDQVDREIEWIAMAQMLDLTGILEWVIHRLNQGALTQQNLGQQRHQSVFHILYTPFFVELKSWLTIFDILTGESLV
jgi:hypothetical protein